MAVALATARTAAAEAESDLAGMLHPPPEAMAPDARAPLHLTARMAAHQKANMRAHLEAVQGIVAGLGTNNWALIANWASRMGASPGTLRMCRHMGEGNPPDFTERAIAFHESADRIAAAAATHDRDRTLAALADTLVQCTGCHAAYKQGVADGE